jgi:hypothetical protein
LRGSLWIANGANANSEPTPSNSDWDLATEKGDQGDPGQQGTPGADGKTLLNGTTVPGAA